MRLIAIFMLILSCQATVFSQKKDDNGLYKAQYECIWSVKFIDDTIKMIPGIEDRFILQVGDDFSYQYGYHSQQRDSMFRSFKNPEDMPNFIKNHLELMRNSNLRESGTMRYNAFGPVKLVKDYKAKKIIVNDRISSYSFAYEENLIPQNWEIQDDTITIAGYVCQKAVCYYRGRSYEAWFASEIPISEGPWKFHGLPGLILYLYDTQHHYEFELVELKNIDSIIDVSLIISNKWKKIDRKELLRMQWGKQGDLIKSTEMAKIGLSNTPVIRNHDYIELDYK